MLRTRSVAEKLSYRIPQCTSQYRKQVKVVSLSSSSATALWAPVPTVVDMAQQHLYRRCLARSGLQVGDPIVTAWRDQLLSQT